jgi:hypothetical protein
MVYDTSVGSPPSILARVRQGRLREVSRELKLSGRTVLKGGRLIDPANRLDGDMDVAIEGTRVMQVADPIRNCLKSLMSGPNASP